MRAPALALLLGLGVAVGATPANGADGKVKKDCTFRGKRLYGKFKVVDVFPDFKVKVVKVFADLHVKPVKVFADACGKWQRVDVFPDFTVKFVDVFPDFTIKFVDVFPGVP